MSDLGEQYRVAAVRFARTFPGPVERVWGYLTIPSKLSAWFGDNSTIEPRAGGAVNLMGGHVRGVVTQWKPNCRLAYTWNVFDPGEQESRYPESYLTLELAEDGRNVALTLTHLPVLERFEKQNAMGWHTFLDILGATARSETVEPRAAYMRRNADRYGVDLDNLMR